VSRLHLTDRALSDIAEIERYSIMHGGQRVADRYLADLGDALGRLGDDPSLFRRRRDATGRLRFYRVREHVIVGDVIDGVVFVLTLWHCRMDFMDRLPQLEPELRREATFLARQIAARNEEPPSLGPEDS